MINNIQDFMDQARRVVAIFERHCLYIDGWLLPAPIAAELMMLNAEGKNLPIGRPSRQDLGRQCAFMGIPYQTVDFIGHPMVVFNMRTMTFDEVLALFIMRPQTDAQKSKMEWLLEDHLRPKLKCRLLEE